MHNRNCLAVVPICIANRKYDRKKLFEQYVRFWKYIQAVNYNLYTMSEFRMGGKKKNHLKIYLTKLCFTTQNSILRYIYSYIQYFLLISWFKRHKGILKFANLCYFCSGWKLFIWKWQKMDRQEYFMIFTHLVLQWLLIFCINSPASVA